MYAKLQLTYTTPVEHHYQVCKSWSLKWQQLLKVWGWDLQWQPLKLGCQQVITSLSNNNKLKKKSAFALHFL